MWRFRRRAGLAALVGLGTLAAVLASPRTMPGYLVRQGVFQAELLYGRVPVEDVLATNSLTPARAENLRRVAPIKAFGASIGLASTENYGTIHPTWSRQIWNLSACHPTRFESVRWWFPVVGSMPYIGFFRQPDARERAAELEQQGLDVSVRTAGAYSTLGWFADPVLPDMLDWPETQLSDTLLHELAHATLWVPGSAMFNESFANVVGETASRAWMVHTYGEGSPEVETLDGNRADGERYRLVLHGLYEDLDALYQDPRFTEQEKRLRKAMLYESLPSRVALAGIGDGSRFAAALQRGAWNNARLVQFRTYNRGAAWFRTVLAEGDGDIGRFIARIREITSEGGDPWAALGAAVGADPAELEIGDG
ncbi:MAG: aminopeptidase [Deltaproteobacteria bacterium]|nr:aminopeptidase [Deltaproteobacteria bacterium]